MKKIIRLLNTIKYLKFKQIYFRLFYFFRARLRRTIGFKYLDFSSIRVTQLAFVNSIHSYNTFENKSFDFLNISKKFDNKIDWNYNQHGKLWTYNLTYFDYLNQENIEREEALHLIYDFMEQEENLKDAIEPFSISLRGINWIKFLTVNSINDENINQILYKHYNILLDNIEYHLLGNHLLENGFSLLFGAYYFQDEQFYAKAKEILKSELEEQILDDGAHFELSPMYHQIMLFRALDCINLVQNNDWKKQELLELLQMKAEIMLGWLKTISYKDGSIPLLNDSANGIAPTSNELFEYANNLKLKIKNAVLIDSGYRKISNDNYECVVDIGNIGASYIPGHVHADTFNFEMRIEGNPFIVDTGLSTYEASDRRNQERGTVSHNTVEVAEKDSSEVWSGFRVANRSNIIELEEKENYIKATHDGYKKIGVLHTREWKFYDDKIIIEDNLNKETNAVVRLHFHPSIDDKMIEKYINIQNCPMEIPSGAKFNIKNYKYAPEFNTLVDAKLIEIAFQKNCKVEIKI